MKNLQSINKIRKKIDKLDQQMLDLIECRKKLVDQVVKLKTKDEIIDQVIINIILLKLDSEAKKKKLPQKMVRDMLKKMIDGFIEYEKKFFEKNEK